MTESWATQTPKITKAAGKTISLNNWRLFLLKLLILFRSCATKWYPKDVFNFESTTEKTFFLLTEFFWLSISFSWTLTPSLERGRISLDFFYEWKSIDLFISLSCGSTISRKSDVSPFLLADSKIGNEFYLFFILWELYKLRAAWLVYAEIRCSLISWLGSSRWPISKKTCSRVVTDIP